jgi:hypothetical protein
MNPNRYLGLFAGALLTSAAAFADDTGFYLGGSLGASQQNFDAATFDVHNTDAIGLFAVGFLPIPVVDLYGKVGIADWRTDAQSPFLSFHRTGDDLA